MREGSQGMIIDTPKGIQAYRYIATLRGLEMEIRMVKEHGIPPTACPTRGMALRSAKGILSEHDLYTRGRSITRKEARKRLIKLMFGLHLCNEDGGAASGQATS